MKNPINPDLRYEEASDQHIVMTRFMNHLNNPNTPNVLDVRYEEASDQHIVMTWPPVAGSSLRTSTLHGII